LRATAIILQMLVDLVLDVNQVVDKHVVFACVKKEVQRLLDGKFDDSAFILSAKITKPLAEYKGDSVIHVELLKRLERENPGMPRAQVGDRVQFILADVPSAQKGWQRARTPEEVMRSGGALRIDYVFNYLRRCRLPLMRFLVPWCPKREVEELLDLSRYRFRGSASGADRGRSSATLINIPQTDIRVHLKRMQAKRTAEDAKLDAGESASAVAKKADDAKRSRTEPTQTDIRDLMQRQLQACKAEAQRLAQPTSNAPNTAAQGAASAAPVAQADDGDAQTEHA
jgi:hypothetical protein